MIETSHVAITRWMWLALCRILPLSFPLWAIFILVLAIPCFAQMPLRGAALVINQQEYKYLEKLPNPIWINTLLSRLGFTASTVNNRSFSAAERVSGGEAGKSNQAELDEAQDLDSQGVKRYHMGDYDGALPLLRRSLMIREKVLGPEHLDTAVSLNNLAMLLFAKGDYGAAEGFHRRSLAIREKVLGPEHTDVALSLNNLALLLSYRGNYEVAEPLYRRALEIYEKILGPEHLDTAMTLNNLAFLLDKRGDYGAAEHLYRRALTIKLKVLGIEHPDTAGSIGNLAFLLDNKGDYDGALQLHRYALAIYERTLGPEHPDTVTGINNVALMLHKKGDYGAAEPLYRRVLAVREKVLGLEHPVTAMSINNLAGLLEYKGDYVAAESLYRRALAIMEKVLGPNHPDTARSLNNLAVLLDTRGDYDKAESLYRRALAIREKRLGPEHPDTAQSLNNVAFLLEMKGAYRDADPLYRRALTIREKVLGPDHPDTALSVNNLALLLDKMGDYDAAERLYRRALATREKMLGPVHPDTAASINNLALLIDKMGDYSTAEPLYRRALAIYEKALGPKHANTATGLNNLGFLLYRRGDYDAAEPLYRRALAIREEVLGPMHPDTASSLNNLAALIDEKGEHGAAVALYRRALAIREQVLGPEHSSTALSLNNLAALLNDGGSRDEGLDLARKAANAGYPSRSIYLSALHSPNLAFSQKVAESFSVIQSTMSSEAGAALTNLAARFGAEDSKLAHLVREEQDLSTELINLDKAFLEDISKPTKDRNKQREQAMQDKIGTLKSRLSSVRTSLAAGFPDYAELQKPRPLALSETQKLLRSDEALVIIDTVNDGNGDYIWAVTSSDASWHKLGTSKGEINALVAGLLPSLNPSNYSLIDVAKAHRLYQITLGQVEKLFSGKKHLFFVLNGAMTSLPPHVLVTRGPSDDKLSKVPMTADHAARGLAQANDDSENDPGNATPVDAVARTLREVDWLIKDYAITVLPTVSSLKLLRAGKAEPTAPRPMRGYADIAYAQGDEGGRNEVAWRSIGIVFRGGVANTSLLQGANPLPATGPEVRAVMQVLGGDEHDIITGRAASESEVKSANLSEYRVLYFATHGLVAGEVEELVKVKGEPALLFAVPNRPTPEDDGLLMASEVAQLRLNADWAVLSACNTAAGGKPGAPALSGLARAFFYAGARSLLVSHWAVDDEATKVLMVRLFDAVKENPDKRAAQAHREAMLSVMNDENHLNWASPAYWAPFILVGEPR